MKTTKFTGEQIAFALRQAETDTKVDEAKMGICKAAFSNWLGFDLGVGDWRSNPLSHKSGSHQLLRTLQRTTGIGRERATRTAFQKAQ